MFNEYKEPDFMLEAQGRDKRFPSVTATGIIMLLVFASFMLFSELIGVAIRLLGITEEFKTSAAVNYGVTAIYSMLFIGLPLLVALFMYPQDIKFLLRLNAMPFKQIILVVVIGLLAFVANILLTVVNTYASSFVGIIYIPEVPAVISVTDKLMLVLSVAIVAPIMEELIMRGVIMRGFEGKSKWFSFIVTGAFFGLLHLSYDTMIPKVLMGILLCYIVYVTNSVYSGIIIHFINNGISVLTEILSSGASVEETAGEVAESVDIHLLSAADRLIPIIICSVLSIGFVVAIIALSIALRNMNKTPNEDGTYTNRFSVREKLSSESNIKFKSYIAIIVTFVLIIGYMALDFMVLNGII